MDRPVIIYFGKGGQYIENSCLSVVQRRHACECWPKSNDFTRVAMRFGLFTGMDMDHCHILEQEDITMMRNYMIMDPMMPEM